MKKISNFIFKICDINNYNLIKYDDKNDVDNENIFIKKKEINNLLLMMVKKIPLYLFDNFVFSFPSTFDKTK